MKSHFKPWLTKLVVTLATLALMLSAASQASSAGPWYVAPGGDDNNDCLSPGTACASINGPIAKASPGDTIYVAIGTYTGTGDEVVLIDKDITLSGGWDSTFTTQSGTSTIDGEGARRGMTVNDNVTATVRSFTIQNGFSGDGGGIANGGALTLISSIVMDNTAVAYGGGILSYGTLLRLDFSTVSGNEATTGAGGGIFSSNTLTLNNSAVIGNAAASVGGGIYNNFGGTATLHSSTISGNTATMLGSTGGGIYSAGTLTLNNSAVIVNTAASTGGGIRNNGGTLALNNSTISGNAVDGDGGGIYHRGTLTLNSSTISGNAASYGGGIYLEVGDSGTTTLENTVFAGNIAGSGPDCSGSIGSAGYNLIGDTSGCDLTPGPGDLTNTDPLLGPLQNNGGSTDTHALLSGSPAIDAGNPAGCTDHLGNPLTTDQRGVPRPQGTACDMGAYEFVPVGLLEVTIDIKPGSDPNSINCNNQKSVIAVAILTTEDFDATSVDHTTVTFEGASERHVDKKSGEPRRHEEDVDYDGDTDLLFHFRLGDTVLTCDSTDGTLIGQTFDGQSIEGSDAVRMVKRRSSRQG